MLQATAQPMKRKGNGALGTRCDFIGSPTNLVSYLYSYRHVSVRGNSKVFNLKLKVSKEHFRNPHLAVIQIHYIQTNVWESVTA